MPVAWQPDTHELYSVDNGIDVLGADAQPEDLWLSERGSHSIPW
jgi:glucose/arabinose dehydrogenase